MATRHSTQSSSATIRRMRWMTMPAALAVAAFSIACAYENPVQPLPRPVDTSAPFTLTIGTASNTVTARVQNANGAPLGNIVVQFATNVGSVSPSAVTTSVDGKAVTTLTAADTATVTATAGSLSAHSLVAAQGSGTGGGAPTPPGSTPTAAPAFLNVSPNGTVGAPVTFTVSSSAPGPWSWSFGDGVNTQTSAFTATHTYGRPGTYAPSVSSSATNAAGATITITDAPAPATPSYTVSLAASPTSVTVGGSATLTASVTPLNGAPPATGFAWDCDGTGTTVVPGGSTHPCTYPTAGTITSKVTVTGGTATGSGTTTVTVTPVILPAFAVNIVPASFNPAVGAATHFTATVTSAGPVPTLLLWQWDDTNDGTYDVAIPDAGSPNSRDITFGSSGVKTVKVTVTDTATARTASGLVTVTVP